MSRAVEGAPGAAPPAGPCVRGRQGAWGTLVFPSTAPPPRSAAEPSAARGFQRRFCFHWNTDQRPPAPWPATAQVRGANPSPPRAQVSCGYCVLLATLLAPAGWHHQPLPGCLCSVLRVKTGASWGQAGPRVLWKGGEQEQVRGKGSLPGRGLGHLPVGTPVSDGGWAGW